MLDGASSEGHRTGILAEFSPTDVLFTDPEDPHTEAYITGRLG
jgi:phosphate transport system ATP-binding protein